MNDLKKWKSDREAFYAMIRHDFLNERAIKMVKTDYNDLLWLRIMWLKNELQLLNSLFFRKNYKKLIQEELSKIDK